MIIVALRGEIAINLKGESDTTKDGKLVNTFKGRTGHLAGPGRGP